MTKMKVVFYIFGMNPVVLLLALITSAAFAEQNNSFTDPRDGKQYKTVKIGSQIWMAENLNYAAEKSLCYDKKEENCAKYGRLYNWETAMKACPKGWHLPRNEEWDILYKYVDNNYEAKKSQKNHSRIAGKYLKAGCCWFNNGNGEDKYDFKALPGGYSKPDGSFGASRYMGYWWGATEHDTINSYYRNMVYFNDWAVMNNFDKTNLLSVRCVRD